MIVAVVVLCVVAVAAVALTIVTRRRLRASEQRAAAVAERAAAAEQHSLQSDQRAADAERLAAEAERAAGEARERAAAAEQEAADRATQAEHEADERVAAAEQRAAAAAAAEAEAGARRRAAAAGRIDPQLLWAMERARSERTWRLSVALDPTSASVFADSPDPLREALLVEVDATREEVGTHAELDAEIPQGITASGSVLVLRAAQELLAAVVRSSEAVILVIRPNDAAMDVTINTFDEEGRPLPPPSLDIPPSDDVEPIDGGLRIHNAVAGRESVDAQALPDV